MALNFPTNPTPGQIHSESGKAWQWSGTSWDFFSNSIPSSSYSNYSISSTAAVSASYALNSNTSNTSSYADYSFNSTSASYAPNSVTSSYADYSFNSTSASYALSSSQTCFIGNNNACIAINNPGNTRDGSNVVISAGDSNNCSDCSVCIGCVSIRAGSNSNGYFLSGGDINIISGRTSEFTCKNGNINLTAGACGGGGIGGNINICSPGTSNTSGVVEIRSGLGNSGGSIVVCGDQGVGNGSGGVSISAGNDGNFNNSQASVDITTHWGGGKTGNLNFYTGESNFGGVGDINIYTGNSQHDYFGPPGNINICAGKAESTGGNIILNTSTGMFGNGGNITLCASVPFAASAVLNLKSDGTAAITATAGMSICTCGNGVCDENGHRFVVATTVPVTNGTYCLTGSITVVNGIITAIT